MTSEERDNRIREALRKLEVARWSEIKRETGLEDATLTRGLDQLINSGEFIHKGDFYALKKFEELLLIKVGIWGENLELAFNVMNREKGIPKIDMALQILEMLKVEPRLKVKVVAERLGIKRISVGWLRLRNSFNELKKRKLIRLEKGEIYLLLPVKEMKR